MLLRISFQGVPDISLRSLSAQLSYTLTLRKFCIGECYGVKVEMMMCLQIIQRKQNHFWEDFPTSEDITIFDAD